MMSSEQRIRRAVEQGILPIDSVFATLGNVGVSAAEQLSVADRQLSHEPSRVSIDFIAALEQVFDTARRLYEDRLGFKPPSMEALEQAGYSKSALFDAYEIMHLAGMQPEIVLAPDLSITSSVKLIGLLAEDVSLPNKRPLNEIIVDYEIDHDAWQRYTRLRPADQPIVHSSSKRWTISVMTGRYAPELRDTDYRTMAVTPPSITQLLALHYQRIQTGGEMIDGTRDGTDFYSWAAGEPGVSYAPTIRWDSTISAIEVSLTPRSVRSPSLGVRPPEWQAY